MRLMVWYLGHSGFAVKAGDHLLVFDYYLTTPEPPRQGLEGGVIDAETLGKFKTVTVFASHAHPDHFTPEILKWADGHPNIRTVLSHDIRHKAPNAIVAHPEKTYDLGDMTVQTLPSTDEGVAFIVTLGDARLYHAGDLNWWHWEGEPEEDNRAQERDYTAQMAKIRGTRFDAAFVPVDPRLEKEALWGINAFMAAAEAKNVFPMHFWDDYSIFDRIDTDPAAQPYRDRVRRITRRGQRFELEA
jgi:L-ascorbate metabolism protein UlaG (beta-lactamase superfamily)